MFTYDGRNLPSIVNYADARRVWAKAKPWRGQTGTYSPRKLDRNKKHVSIRMGNNQQIICKLHRTDVVVYHADGNIDVDCSYSSRSTNEFIYRLLRGAGITVHTTERQPVAWCGWTRGQHVNGNVATFVHDPYDDTPYGWKLLNPAPTHTFALKRDVTKQLRLDYRYSDFRLWRKMYIITNGNPQTNGWRSRHNPNYRPNDLQPVEITQALRDGVESWPDLANRCTESYVLDSIYRYHTECVAVVERVPFVSYEDYRSWKALDRRYGWAVKGY